MLSVLRRNLYLKTTLGAMKEKTPPKHFFKLKTTSELNSKSFPTGCQQSFYFWVYGAKKVLQFKQPYFLVLLMKEKGLGPTVIKIANHFWSLNFSNVMFLGVMNFLEGATTLDSFLEAKKHQPNERGLI